VHRGREKGNRPGDILVWGRSPNIGLRVEAYRSAGNGLRSLGQFALALDQYEKALALAPDDLESRRQKGLLLGRLKQSDAAKEWLQNLVKEVPDDAESWALLGRVEKDSWISGWRADGKTVEQMQQDAAATMLCRRRSILCQGALQRSPHYYSGINAVALTHLLSHLTGKEENLKHERKWRAGWAVRGR
jgi:tetratricopeptide (TPR) repeat protein